MRLLIRGGRVLDPCSGTDGQLDVLVQDGAVERLGEGLAPDADEVLDVRGAWVLPGIVDMHVHLRQPGQEHQETIATGTRAAAAGGVTAVACMPDTQPPIDHSGMVEQVRALAAREGLVRVYVVGAVTVGRQGQRLTEMGELARSGAVAFSDHRALMDASVMRSALTYAGQLGRPVITYAMDAALARGGIMREGELSFRLGLPGIPAEAETVMVARDVELARLSGAHLHVAHVSAARSVELIRQAREQGVRVTAEVTPHHLMLTHEAMEAYDASVKVEPPLGTAEDRQALRRALAEGVIDCVASDHSPHAVHEKQAELDQAPFGAVGLETLASVVLGHLVAEGLLSPLRAVDVLTAAPARILGLPGRCLRPGAVADITIFDPKRRWQVDPARLRSRGRNTPFAGWEMRGQAVATVVGGRLVMRDGELLD